MQAANKSHELIERLLAFSFATADVLIQFDENLRAVFASGAVESLMGRPQSDVLGKSFWEMLAPSERVIAKNALDVLAPQTRMPFLDTAILAPNARCVPVALSAYRLDRPAPSYFITVRRRSAPEHEIELLARADKQTGLMTEGDFGAAALRIETEHPDARLTMLDLSDLHELARRTDRQSLELALMQIGVALNSASIDCRSAARLNAAKMGFLHDPHLDVDAVRRKIEEIGKSIDPTGAGLKIRECTLPLAEAGLNADEKSQVLRYAIRRFADEGLEGFNPSSIKDVLRGMVRDTVTRLDSVRQTITGKSLDVAYQPIVHLDNRRVHHWEALCRPMTATSPAKMVRFAEQIGLSHEFDLMVCSKILHAIEGAEKRGLKPSIALNLSAKSLLNDIFLDAFCELMTAKASLRGQVLIEITETEELHDLEAAGNIIADLREHGHKVCLDDFGAGAAGFSYLQALSIDYVKIDGAYIKDLARNPRDAAIVRAIASLCEEIGVEVVAEMVETEEQAKLAARLGVELGQGFHFGKPKTDEDFTPPDANRPALNLRRKGFAETWQ